jgi:hypothetical protein
MGSRWEPDTKTDWPTDRRSLINFNFNFNFRGDAKFHVALLGQ